jgi:predicted ATPase with chaperone activity
MIATTIPSLAADLRLLAQTQADADSRYLDPADLPPIPHPQSPGFPAPVPHNIAETGLPPALIEHLVFNILYSRGALTGRELADALGLGFEVIEPPMADLKARYAVEVKSSAGFGLASSLFALSEMGRKRAREYFEISQYAGPAPVPFDQYCQAVAAQRLPKGWLTQEQLQAIYQDAVVAPEVLEQIGPAVNSGRSFLMYGLPGNGKTFLAEALLRLLNDEIFIPYAVEHHGAIVQIYDALYHKRSTAASFAADAISKTRLYDGRWARCLRPFLSSGGELGLDMLELRLNAGTKVYDAPFHVKANNGIYLIDDFGRQRVSPAALLNRWIVPMESRVDHLDLASGGKLAMPFEIFLVFSTNLTPTELGDEAFLRRIQYKMLVRNPSLAEFRDLFRLYASKQGLDCPDALLDKFLSERYDREKKPFRRCHPRDILLHVADLIEFLRLPHVLTAELLDRAFESCFAVSEEDPR